MIGNVKLLLIDTCGATAGVAACLGQQVLGSEDFVQGSASAEIIPAVHRLLSLVNWRLRDLDAVGVVSGPGSFTGMRAGLATAKGLCEAAGVTMAAVSRLEVLADASGLREGIVALDAGRGELYVRDIATGREELCSGEGLESVLHGRSLVVAETHIGERFATCAPMLCPLRVVDAIATVLRCLGNGGTDAALIDANYVRAETDLYRNQSMTAKTVRAD